MRYCGEADVDGSRQPWTEVVSHATPPHLVKVKIRKISSEIHVERNGMFVWFNKNNNLKSHFRTSKNA